MLARTHIVRGLVPSRIAKETRFNQRASVIWLYGLSGAGKTTLGRALERELFERGFATTFLDGDELRSGLNVDLGYSLADRAENVRRSAETAKLLMHSGLVVVCAFMTPTAVMRRLVRSTIGVKDFVGIYVRCSTLICEQRDVKGLYSKARSGEITNLPGKTTPFEVPESEDLIIDTENETFAACLELLVAHTLLQIEVPWRR